MIWLSIQNWQLRSIIKQIVSNTVSAWSDKWFFVDEAALLVEYPNWIGTPSDRNGWYAIVWDTDTVWVWDTEWNIWLNSYSTYWDMTKAVYDTTNKQADVYSMDNADETTTKKVLTSDERIKLDWIEPLAEVNTNYSTIEYIYTSINNNVYNTWTFKTYKFTDDGWIPLSRRINLMDSPLETWTINLINSSEVSVYVYNSSSSVDLILAWWKSAMVTITNNSVTPVFLEIWVSWPVTSTDNAVVRYDWVTWDVVLDSSVIIDDDWKISWLDSIKLNTTTTPWDPVDWEIKYNTDESTIDVWLPWWIIWQLFEEWFFTVKADWETLSNWEVVMFSWTDWNSGNYKAKKFINDWTNSAVYLLWIMTQEVIDWNEWKATWWWKVRWIQTNWVNYWEVWSEWDVLYPSTTLDWWLTNVAPESPAIKTQIAVVISEHVSNGTLGVRVIPNASLNELNDVDITTASTWDILTRNWTHWMSNPVFNDTKQLTWFIDSENVVKSYDSTARTITLTHTSWEIVYYWKWQRKSLVSPWVSDAHAVILDTIFFLSSDDWDTFSWSTTMWSFFDAQIAYCYYGTSDKFGWNELHWVMNPENHLIAHRNIWTFRYSGWWPTTWTYAIGIDTDAAITPWFDSAVIYDEDNPTTISAWIEWTYTTSTIWWGNLMVFDTENAFPFNSTVAWYINYNDAASWIEIEWASNKYYNVYQIMVPTTTDVESKKYRTVLIQPQVEFDTLVSAKWEDFQSINLWNFINFAAESITYTRLTYMSNASYSTTGKVELANISYLAWSRASQVNISWFNQVAHNNLSDLSWVNSWHLATANTIAWFDESWVAIEVVAITPLDSESTTNYYVETTWNDSNNGSIWAPFLTIQKAASMIPLNIGNVSYVINIWTW